MLNKKFPIQILLLLLSTSFAYSQKVQVDSVEQVRLSAQLQKVNIRRGHVITPKIKGYNVELIGSDNKAVIDLKGDIHKPLVSKQVNLLYKLTRKKDKAVLEIPVKEVAVSGQFNDSGDHNKPFVIPSLREWHGQEGEFTLGAKPRIVIQKAKDGYLKEVAELLKDDLNKLLAVQAEITTGKPVAGDIYLSSNSDISLGTEGYALTIDEVFHIAAPTYKGSVFGTRTLLQLLAQNPKRRSIPRGESRDYPTYEVRGLVLDVGRKFFTIDFLSKYVEFMSYYKMSNFQIHLNDNAFSKYFDFDWDKTPSGFRLENDTYPGLASSDGHYTKKEFIDLQRKAQRYGITIIPEIDVPAHSLAIVKAVPEIGSDKYGRDHLDLGNPKTKEVVANIFKEYISGPNPVFIGEQVHIGTDEYDKSEAELFRDFTDYLIKLVQAEGKDARAWGALTHAQGKTPVTVDNVTLNMWYNGYADPVEMKKLGYKQISTPDGWLYIVPAAGYYYDYLNTDHLYKSWEPRKIGDVVFEKGDPIVVGGMFALWNDIAGNGISEYDAHNRVFPAMQILAEKMWTASDSNPSLVDFNKNRKLLLEAPGLNMRGVYPASDSLLLDYSFEGNLSNAGSLEKNQASANNVEYKPGIFGNALVFSTEQSTFEPAIPAIGGNYTVSFWIKPEANLSGELFKSQGAVITATANQIAYERDGYSYQVGELFPVSKWSFVTITANEQGVQFYRDGQLFKDMSPEEITLPYKDKGGKEIKYTKVKTLQFPLQRISLGASHLDSFKVYRMKMNAQQVSQAYQSEKQP